MSALVRYIRLVTRVSLPVALDDERIPDVFYTDVALRYCSANKWMGSPELLADVNILFNRTPPMLHPLVRFRL